MGFIKTLLFIIVSIFLIAFCAVNKEIVSINLFPFPYLIELPLFIFSLLCVIFGIIMGSLVSNMEIMKLRNSLRKIKKRCVILENENKSMRSESEYASLAIEKQK
ncbi:MAG: LapA family protein [Rickettsiales bacterium]